MMFLILPGKIQTTASISWDIDFWQGGPEKKNQPFHMPD